LVGAVYAEQRPGSTKIINFLEKSQGYAVPAKSFVIQERPNISQSFPLRLHYAGESEDRKPVATTATEIFFMTLLLAIRITQIL
jgi:hypothetical protein